jgi:hypothetical protein
MAKPNEEGLEDNPPRTIKLVITDDGKTKFNFYMEGDCERLNMPQIPTSLYSASEWWALQFYTKCKEMLDRHGEVKHLNREERRKQ